MSHWNILSNILQMLTIHLGQDETDCFSAWVSGKEAGFTNDEGGEQRCNYGNLLLKALLDKWWRTRAEDDDNGLEQITVPPHTPFIIGFVFILRIFFKDYFNAVFLTQKN